MASAYAPRLKKQRYDVITCRKNGALTFAHGFPAPEQYLLQDVAAQLPKLNISFGNLTSESSSDQARKATAKPLLNASYDCHVRICVRLHDGGTRAPPVFRSAAVRVRGSSTEARSLVLELEKPVEISIASLCEFGREEVLLTRAVDVNFDIFANDDPVPFMMDDTRRILRYAYRLKGNLNIEPGRLDNVCFAAINAVSLERPGIWPPLECETKLAVNAYWMDPMCERLLRISHYQMPLDDRIDRILTGQRAPLIWLFNTDGNERVFCLQEWQCALCSRRFKDHWSLLTHALLAHKDLKMKHHLQADHECGVRLLIDVGPRPALKGGLLQRPLDASADSCQPSHVHEPNKLKAETSQQAPRDDEDFVIARTLAKTPTRANQAVAGSSEQRPPLSIASRVETVDITMADDSDDVDNQQAFETPRQAKDANAPRQRARKDMGVVYSSHATSTVSSLENLDPTMPGRVQTKDDRRQLVTKPHWATYRSPLADAARPMLSPRSKLSPRPKFTPKPRNPPAEEPANAADTARATSTRGRRFRIPEPPEGVQFYSSVTKVPLYEGDSASESDAASDHSPIRLELEGKSDHDKFKNIFNAHLQKEHLKADCHFKGCWQRFAEQSGALIKEHRLMKDFVVRAAFAKLDGLLTDKDVAGSVAVVQAAAVEESPPPRPPAPKSRVGCFCGKDTSDVMNIISCYNVECDDPDFHLHCVGLESWQEGWLCPDCRAKT